MLVTRLRVTREENDEGSDENVEPLISFLNENREKLEAEGNGEIICATKFETDAPTIDAVLHENGKTRHAFVDLNQVLDVDEFAYVAFDVSGCSSIAEWKHRGLRGQIVQDLLARLIHQP